MDGLTPRSPIFEVVGIADGQQVNTERMDFASAPRW